MLRITFAAETLKIRHKIRYKEGYGITKQCYFTVRRARIFIWGGVVENVRYVHKRLLQQTQNILLIFPEKSAWKIHPCKVSWPCPVCCPIYLTQTMIKRKVKKDTDFWWTSLENLLPEGKGLAQQRICRALQLGVCRVHIGNVDIYSSPSESFSQPLCYFSSICRPGLLAFGAI